MDGGTVIPELVRADERHALVIIGARPWWLYSRDDYPGFTEAQIEAGLTVPAVEQKP